MPATSDIADYIFEHFRRLEICWVKRKKQRLLQERFKKKADKIKRVVYFQNISVNFKSGWGIGNLLDYFCSQENKIFVKQLLKLFKRYTGC